MLQHIPYKLWSIYHQLEYRQNFKRSNKGSKHYPVSVSTKVFITCDVCMCKWNMLNIHMDTATIVWYLYLIELFEKKEHWRADVKMKTKVTSTSGTKTSMATSKDDLAIKSSTKTTERKTSEKCICEICTCGWVILKKW